MTSHPELAAMPMPTSKSNTAPTHDARDRLFLDFITPPPTAHTDAPRLPPIQRWLSESLSRICKIVTLELTPTPLKCKARPTSTKVQRPRNGEAFGEMLTFMFGWNPPHIVGSKVVSIDFKESPDKNTYTLTIPDILEEKGVMKRDSEGKPLNVVPAMDL